MNNITAKRSVLKFYVLLGFCFFLFVLMGTGVLSIALVPDNNTSTMGAITLCALAIGIYALGFYSVYIYFKNVPVIKVNFDGISMGKHTYYWSDIKDIALTGKQPFKYIFGWPMEGAKLTLNDGKKIYLFDDMYSNLWQVKLFIQEVAVNKNKTFELPDATISTSEMESEAFDTFKGNPVFSFRGITCWGFIVFFIILLLFDAGKNDSGLVVFIVIFGLGWLLLHSWLMYYFRVSQNFLVIRNHILFWKNKPYRLTDIREVVFETQGKMPNCMRVITKDFRVKLYPAGTLRDKTWLLLKEKLEGYGVTVRNECI